MFQPSLRLRAIWCVWLMSHIFRPTVTLVWTLIQDKRTHSECAFPEWGFFCLMCSVRIDKRNLRTPDYCEVRKTLVLMSTTWLNVDFVNIHWTRLQCVQNFLQSEKREQGPNRAERQADKTSDVNSAASEDRIQSDSRLLFSALLSPQKGCHLALIGCEENAPTCSQLLLRSQSAHLNRWSESPPFSLEGFWLSDQVLRNFPQKNT